MEIRRAEVFHGREISILMEQLGYPTEEGLIERRLAELSGNPDHMDVVLVVGDAVLGFLSMHFIPQIAFDTAYAVISYLVVDQHSRSTGIGRLLEQYAERIAIEKNCRRLFLHSNIRRIEAHRFYIRQGYQEYNKAFVKYLDR